MGLTPVLLGFDAVLLAAAARFTRDAFREREARAARMGAAAMVVLAGIGILVVWVPGAHAPLAIDNFVFDKRWRPRPAPEWIAYPAPSRRR